MALPALCTTAPSAGRSRLLLLLLILMLFAMLRIPVMLQMPGGEDEEFFAVPGWTILRDGVPRIPYLPGRDPGSAFYRADDILLAMPPAYFYWEAAAFALLGPGYGPARLASGAASCLAIVLCYALGRAWLKDPRTALGMTALYSVSRLLYFPSLFARPDTLCGALGLAAVWAVWQWTRRGQLRWLICGGLFTGLGGLTHPFALLYAVQLGVWALCRGPGWKRQLFHFGLLAGTAVAVFALWLPLILRQGDLFRIQFGNNVLNSAGPGLVSRLIWPLPWLNLQSHLFLHRAGPCQAILCLAGLSWATYQACWNGVRSLRPPVLLAWSGTYLEVALLGPHATMGHWCYIGAFYFLSCGAIWDSFRQQLPALWRGRAVSTAAALLLAAAMIPGGGLRLWWTHVRSWRHPDYDARTLVRRILADTPSTGRYLVDRAHVLDFYLAGRDTVLAFDFPFLFDSTDLEYDFLVTGPNGLRKNLPGDVQGRFLRSYGRPDDLLACYAEVYRSPSASGLGQSNEEDAAHSRLARHIHAAAE